MAVYLVVMVDLIFDRWWNSSNTPLPNDTVNFAELFNAECHELIKFMGCYFYDADDIKLKKSGFFQVHLSKELHAFGMCWLCHSKIPFSQ